MTKVAILGTVWLHLIVVGAFVGMESLRCEKLRAPGFAADVAKQREWEWLTHVPALPPPGPEYELCGTRTDSLPTSTDP